MISRYIDYPLDLSYGIPRTPGIHLSGVIKIMAKVKGLQEKYSESLSDLIRDTPPEKVGTCGALMRCAFGYAMEEWLGRQLLRRGVDRPGEMCVDDIYMTPDGAEFFDDHVTLHEIKGTFLSSKNPVTDQVKWMWQTAGYMHGLTETYGLPCNTVIIHPFHISGDYKGIDPVYCPQEVVFEDQEVRDVWRDVLMCKGEAEAE